MELYYGEKIYEYDNGLFEKRTNNQKKTISAEDAVKDVKKQENNSKNTIAAGGIKINYNKEHIKDKLNDILSAIGNDTSTTEKGTNLLINIDNNNATIQITTNDAISKAIKKSYIPSVVSPDEVAIMHASETSS